jgi:hypothetical protein
MLYLSLVIRRVPPNAKASTISKIRYEIRIFLLLVEVSTLILYQIMSLGVEARPTYIG